MTYIVVILIGIAYYIWFYRNEAEKFLTKNSMLANKENITNSTKDFFRFIFILFKRNQK